MDSGAEIGRIILIVFVFIDLVLILITALIKKSRSTKLREYTLTAEAVVTDISRQVPKTTPGHGGSPMWYPTFSYTVNGSTYTKKSSVGTSEKNYEQGERIKIQVDPNDPSKFVLVESKGFNIAFGVLCAISALFVIFTIIAGIIVIKR